MSMEFKKTGVVRVDGDVINENLLKVSEANTRITTTTKNFVIDSWVISLYTSSWFNSNIDLNTDYMLSYTATCISVPDSTNTLTEGRNAPILINQADISSSNRGVISYEVNTGNGWVNTSGTLGTMSLSEVGKTYRYRAHFKLTSAVSETYQYYGLCAYTSLYKTSSNTNVYSSFRIEDLKLEKGTVATAWTPNSSDDLYTSNTQGTIETNQNNTRFFNGHIEAEEFIEW